MKLTSASSSISSAPVRRKKPSLPEQDGHQPGAPGSAGAGLSLAGALTLLAPVVQAAPAVQVDSVVTADRLQQEEQTLLAQLKAGGKAVDQSGSGVVSMELGDGGYYTKAHLWGNPSAATPWVNLNVYEWQGDVRTTTVHVEYRERNDESGWRFLERTVGEGGDSIFDARQQTVVNLGNHRVVNHFVSTQKPLSNPAKETLQGWNLSFENPIQY